MATTKKSAPKPVSKHRKMLAAVVKTKGSERAVAAEINAQGLKCSQQAVSAWVKGLWPPRPATQAALKTLYGIPATWSAT